MKYLDKILFSIIIISAVIFTYWKLPLTFFQQDEWLGIGNYLYFNESGTSFLNTSSFHMIPLTVASSYLQFKLFGLNFSYYAIVSIMGHLINTFLVFYLAQILLKNKYLSFFSALFFAVNSMGSQAVIWIAASTSTQTATSFFLLSLIFLSKYILIHKKNIFLLGLSFLFLFIGMFFKETVLSLFVIIPLFWLVFNRKVDKGFIKKILLPLFIIFLVYFLMKITFVTLKEPKVNSSLKPWIVPHASTYAYRIVTLPLKIIPQSMLPAGVESEISKKIVYLGYPQYFAYSETEINPYVAETAIFDMVSYVSSILILFFSYVFYQYFSKNKNNHFLKSLFVGIIIIAGSSFPFIFIPGVSGYFSIYEPRHLYAAIAGSSFVLSILIFGIARMIFHKEKYAICLFMAIMLSLLWLNMRSVREQIDSSLEYGETRKMILSQIVREHKNLPEKVVFYTESDRAYYGMVEDDKILPFQSGFGQTLLVWYKLHGENIPFCFFANDFLYAIEKEGYQECQGRGFGYFRKYESLKAALKENKLSPENVISFSWNSKDKKFMETTAEIRKKLISHF